MASRTVVEMIDDLDQKPIKHGDGETVFFAMDRIEYEIDLSKTNAERLCKVLSVYTEAAQPAGGGRTRRGGPGRSNANGASRDYDPKAVRAWAASHGVDVPTRGRIPTSVVEQFHHARSAWPFPSSQVSQE